MSTGVKIALALLGLSAAGGLAYYFTTRQSGGGTTPGTNSPAGSSGTLTVTDSFAQYEGKYIKGTGPELYKVSQGKKELLPNVVWYTYASRAVVLSDRVLRSIPTK